MGEAGHPACTLQAVVIQVPKLRGSAACAAEFWRYAPVKEKALSSLDPYVCILFTVCNKLCYQPR